LEDRALPQVLAILGPTAVGKTAVAVEIAEKLDGEIVSCDSRQIFKHLEIGTAKPTEAERERVVFHLVDIMEPERFMNAWEFKELAESAIDDIVARGKTPIITVGTGFYFSAMTDGIIEAPSADEEFRREMQSIIDAEGTESLHKRLSDVDPKAASEISANDSVRLIRALELYHSTGKTRGELTGETQATPSPYHIVTVQLALDRDMLYERIDRRCEQMLVDGLIDEARSLREKGILPDEIAAKTVGYKEVFEFLDGRLTEEEMLADFQQSTRNYAKRQLTWFRNHASGRIFDVSDKLLVDSILADFTDGE
jgi:tRNA dimethylallyltransferase